MARQVLIVFARAPRLGQVKRRLAAGIGPVAALRFYRNQLGSILRRLNGLKRVDKYLAVTPHGAHIPHPPGWRVIGQGQGDLGTRMHNAFRRFPTRHVVLVGADIPALSASHIRAALCHPHPAFGPAADGGYYLVAMPPRRPATPFANVRWSTPHALADTLANFQHMPVTRLATLHDVDTGVDLQQALLFLKKKQQKNF
jgi:rSAM/selenodomain-associated transferase 1